MASSYQRTRHTEKKYSDSGPYEAIVVNNLDTKYMGGLTVELLKYTSAGGTPERTGQLLNVKYLSPFYGITPNNALTANEGYQHTQKSYGMWMVPPDVGTRVLVIFAEGNANFGYWIGCIPAEYMNFMVPDGRASTEKTTQADLPEGLKDRKLPVGEYNKANEDGALIDPTLFNKPYNKDFTETLEVQGLLNDEVRGTTTTSARREIPSMVFGVSTPGPKDYRDGAPTAAIGSAKQKISVPSNRLGGSSFVMDDGDDRFVRATHAEDGPPVYKNVKEGQVGDNTIPQNELLRFRTRTGHQLLLHNSEDLIYIGNARGTTWIEMSSDGKIDIHAQDSVSIMTENDLNVTAERDINLEAGRNVNIKATARYNDGSATDKNNAPSGRVQIESAYDYNLHIGADSKVTIAKDHHMKVKKSQYIDTTGNMNIKSDGDNRLTTNAYTHISSKKEHRETATFVHMNGPKAATAQTAKEVDVLGTVTLPRVKPGGIIEPYESILCRAPQHEPWPHHENLDPLSYKKTETDRETPGGLPSANRVLTPDTFFKNTGGRKASAYVAGSGGQINSGTTSLAGRKDSNGAELGFTGSDDYAANPNFEFSEELGSLSAKYESRGEPSAIGYDRTGGWSYGTYQIAANTGAMGNFIKYCEHNYSSLYDGMNALGGENAARSGSDTFKQGWQSLMSDAANAEAQHSFAVKTYFEPAAKRIKRAIGIDPRDRSKTLQDVVWSTSIQHGNSGCQRIFERAVKSIGADTPSDRAMVKMVYLERAASNGMKYFGSSTPAVRKSVVSRFKNELADALKSLLDEQESQSDVTITPDTNLAETPPIGPF